MQQLYWPVKETDGWIIAEKYQNACGIRRIKANWKADARKPLLMQIEIQRLLVRDIETDDAIPFSVMAADRTLNDCGFDKDCGSWITKWIAEAKEFAIRNNPNMDYLAYTITLKDGTVVVIATVRNENIPSWKVIEKAGFVEFGRNHKDFNS